MFCHCSKLQCDWVDDKILSAVNKALLPFLYTVLFSVYVTIDILRRLLKLPGPFGQDCLAEST